jgi:hypothetical protein
MTRAHDLSRREALRLLGVSGFGLALAACASAASESRRAATPGATAAPSGPPRAEVAKVTIALPVQTPHLVERDGLATIVIRLAEEIPAFQNWALVTLAGTREWVEQNPGVVERVCRAMARGCNMLLNDPPASKAALKPVFSDIDPSVVDLGLDSSQGAFNQDARMAEEMWRHAAELFIYARVMETVPPLAEGVLWTNKYLTNRPKA